MLNQVDKSPDAVDHGSDARAKRTLARLGQTLPVRPGPLLDLLADDGSDPRAVVQIIERDPAMAGRVLGVVNSAGHRRLNEITTVHRAVLQLGAGPVRSLGLAMGLQQLAEGLPLDPDRLKAFWNTSLLKAEAADLAAAAIDPACQRRAYSVGLVADLGLPMLMALDPEFYEAVLPYRAVDESWCEAEARHFGIDHARAGAHLLQGWDAPEEIHQAVASHHRFDAEAPEAAVHLAVAIAGLLPHDHSEISPADLDRLMAVHARWLCPTYATPDDFLGRVHAQTQRRLGRDPGRDDGAGLSLRPFLDAVAANSIQLVAQVHQLKTSRRQQQEDLSNLRFEAFTDGLTKLLNRRGFFSLVEQRLEKHPAGVGVCCMMLDLNDFKPVNDRHGHDAGDLVLRGIAKLLRRSLNRTDLIGRLGGDEFVVFLADVSEAQARAAARRICDTALGKAVRIGPGREVPLSFSLGAVHHPAVGPPVPVDALLAAADERMYQRKRTGKPGLLFAPYVDPDGSTIVTSPAI